MAPAIPRRMGPPLNAITRPDIHERLDALTSQGMTVGVNRLQALISRVFAIALDRGRSMRILPHG